MDTHLINKPPTDANQRLLYWYMQIPDMLFAVYSPIARPVLKEDF